VAQQWDANDRRAPGHAPDLQSIAAWLLLVGTFVAVNIMLAVFRALDTTAAVVGSVYRYATSSHTNWRHPPPAQRDVIGGHSRLPARSAPGLPPAAHSSTRTRIGGNRGRRGIRSGCRSRLEGDVSAVDLARPSQQTDGAHGPK
jgi:hypothetical protein